MNFLLFSLILAIFLLFVSGDNQKIVEKCCDSDLHNCCLNSIETNATLRCAGLRWLPTTECIEREFHNESLVKSGAEYCCSLLAYKECRRECIETMRRVTIPIDQRLNIIDMCTIQNSTELDGPRCHKNTVMALDECFPECVDWYRTTDPRTSEFKPYSHCDILSNYQARNPCLLAN